MSKVPALVLTAKAAGEHGYQGGGPFVFPGVPGVYQPDRPVALEHMGLDEKQAKQLLADVFGDKPPLRVVQAGEEALDLEGLRDNHGLSGPEPAAPEEPGPAGEEA